MAYTTTKKIKRKCPHCCTYIDLEVEENWSDWGIRSVKGLGEIIQIEEKITRKRTSRCKK